MKYVRCGAIGHRWYDADTPDWVTSMLGVPVSLVCDQCGTIRVDVLARSTGRLLTRRYIKPLDYNYVGGERPSKDEFRLALIKSRKRLIKKQTA